MIKTGKVTRISQHDADGPGGMTIQKPEFIKTNKEEERKLINQKLKERINQQEELRRLNLALLYRHVEIQELEKIYEIYDEPRVKTIKENINGTPVTRSGFNKDFVEKPKWYGIDMPKKLLEMEIKVKWQELLKGMRTFNYQKSQLMNVGFTEEHIKKVLNGKFIKDTNKLKKMEEKQ